MAIRILDVLGLCVNDIEHAYEACDNALTQVLLESELDTFEDRLAENLKYTESFSLTNSLIVAMFELTEEIIREHYPELAPTYYVNGYNSHFYINDDNVFEDLYDGGVDADTIKKIVKADLLTKTGLSSQQICEIYKFGATTDGECRSIDDLIKSYDNGNDITIYESVEELGEDNSDNDCRDEDDTDEAFGNFLIQAYKDGNSDTLYIPLSDGSVIAAPIE